MIQKIDALLIITPNVIFLVKLELLLLKFVILHFFNQSIHSILTNGLRVAVNKRGNT